MVLRCGGWGSTAQHSTRRLPECDGGRSCGIAEEGWSARSRPGRRPRDVLAGSVDARSRGCPSHWRSDGLLGRGEAASGRGMNWLGKQLPDLNDEESETQERR